MRNKKILFSTLYFVIILIASVQLKAQEIKSFEEYKKQEQAKFKKYVTEEKNKFEAFKKNELDWNKEILGYEVETPVSERVEARDKETALKPPAPKYVNLTASLDNEIILLKRKVNKLLEKAAEEAEAQPVKERTEKPKVVPLATKSNQPKAKTSSVVSAAAKHEPSKAIKSPEQHKESMIEAEKHSIPSIKPISDSYRLSSKFGNRFHPTLFRWRFHGGVDMACPKGTAIHVPADGVVVKSGWNNAYGNYIKVKHSNGFETVYGHLSRIKIKKGQKVFKGEIIGEVGSTGLSTGPHLHYEILKNNKRVNPERFFG